MTMRASSLIFHALNYCCIASSMKILVHFLVEKEMGSHEYCKPVYDEAQQID